ncbi:C-type lectin domain family 17, member A isoform X2 [Equus asinus]|uniref:C-type lectin domain family 17, member A isoform X2 n=1 Tax=Equus asinus TaxID=9793 RepID=UPI001D04646E|nr:C-type lectin domain family 17, member A isoform X2 [Equus asinus]
MPTLYRNSLGRNVPGNRDEEEDYENMAPPYKDLPPKPASMGPPRPPRAGKKTEKPPIPCKPPKITGVDPERPPFRPSLGTTPMPWLGQKPGALGCHQEERLMVYLCLLVVVSLLLGCTGLAVTLIKYQEVVEELRVLTFQQMAWRVNVTGLAGLAGLKRDIDRIRADTNQSLVELRGLLDCPRVTCPEGWLPFEGKCYYFSPSTKAWEEARKFCQENYSHLLIISNSAEQQPYQLACESGEATVCWRNRQSTAQRRKHVTRTVEAFVATEQVSRALLCCQVAGKRFHLCTSAGSIGMCKQR